MTQTKTFDHVHCSQCEKRGDSVFCCMHGENLDEISDSKTCSIYRKGQVLFNEGGHPFGIYCVNKGKIKVSIIGDEGKEQIVRLAKDGDVLGYRSMIASERYNATATALEDSQVCFIPRDIFLGALKKDSNLSNEVMKLLSAQLKEAEIKLTHLAQKPVRERLAETLLFLKETYGFEQGTDVLSVQLSREEIANLVGTATETAIRLLSELNKERIIELVGKKIRITNMKGLIKTANLSDY
ncbi:MAG: Crp/Fnr family transcriptional regulator [Chitinophagaceae bacterium]|nr:Crp/Fnr family transcriptional regulator [Chitinophagaceae bacterium]